MLAHGVVVGRIMKAVATPVGAPWLWTLNRTCHSLSNSPSLNFKSSDSTERHNRYTLPVGFVATDAKFSAQPIGTTNRRFQQFVRLLFYASSATESGVFCSKLLLKRKCRVVRANGQRVCRRRAFHSKNPTFFFAGPQIWKFRPMRVGAWERARVSTTRRE